MGFGYLVIGYIFAMNFVYEGFTMLPGVLLMLNGMLTLGNFNSPLREARLWLFLALPVSVIRFIAELCRMFSLCPADIYTSLGDLSALVLAILLLLFSLRLFSGIAALAVETGLPDIRFRAKRNAFLTALAYLFSIFLSLPIQQDWYIRLCAVAFAPVLLFRLIIFAFNALLLYSCYMYICLPEDLDMPRRDTGIAFLDRLRRKADEKEEMRIAEKKKKLEKIYRERSEKYHRRHDKNDPPQEKNHYD